MQAEASTGGGSVYISNFISLMDILKECHCYMERAVKTSKRQLAVLSSCSINIILGINIV